MVKRPLFSQMKTAFGKLFPGTAADVDIAAVNAPSQVVISGLRNKVAAAIEDLARQGIEAHPLERIACLPFASHGPHTGIL